MSQSEPIDDEVARDVETPGTSDAAEADSGRSSEDLFEFWATILIALAAVAIAWAGFESAKWGGVQATDFSQAGAARTESVRFSTLAGQQATVDVVTFINWLNTAVEDIEDGLIEEPASGDGYQPTPGTLSGFYFERFRDEFTPAVRAWLDTTPFQNPDAPSGPFDMDEYELAATAQAVELQNEADAKAADAGDANQTSDNYVLTAVLFATALFFAALASRLSVARYRYASLIIATIVFLGTTIYILSLPIEI